jgi:hypothetical protein
MILWKSGEQFTAIIEMEKRDYLMDQIEQLGRVLGQILVQLLGLKSEGRVTDGIEIASQTLKTELDFDIDELLSIPTGIFTSVLVQQKKFNNSHMEQLTEIFMLIADELYVTEPQNEKTRNLYLKSLEIYNYLINNDLTYSIDRQFKIERIKNMLS